MNWLFININMIEEPKFYKEKLLSQEEHLLNSLIEFYKNEKNMEKALPIITGTSEISLRLMDHLVTNYSKKHNANYTIDRNGESIIFKIHSEYKNLLKSGGKRFADPFCRENKKKKKNKITFYCGKNRFIITTIAQLNFFRWAIKNYVIEYALDNLDSITKDMNSRTYNKREKAKNKKKVQKKPAEIKISTMVDFNSPSIKYKVTKV